MSQPLLDGEVEYVEPIRLDAHGERLTYLEDRVASLESQLKQVKRDAVVTLLQMLSDSMRHIASGKMDIPAMAATRDDNKWDAVKQRMPQRHREAIDVLLLSGSLKRTQLAAALKMDYANCAKNVIAILIRQGWLIDSGGNLSLKQL